MKELIGRVVVAVKRVQADTNTGTIYALDEINFDDGSRLRFAVREGDRGYSIEPIYSAHSLTLPRDVECPKCGARAGTDCSSRTGHATPNMHKARRTLARRTP